MIKFKMSQWITYFEVVEDVADERDIAHPLLQRAPPRFLTALEFLLEPVQQAPPEHISVALLGLGLHEVTKRGQIEDGSMDKKSGCIAVWLSWLKSLLLLECKLPVRH